MIKGVASQHLTFPDEKKLGAVPNCLLFPQLLEKGRWPVVIPDLLHVKKLNKFMTHKKKKLLLFLKEEFK